MPTTAHVHRSYRIEQEAQYRFEAICHANGQTPSQVLGHLITDYIFSHFDRDNDLAEAVQTIVVRRIEQTQSLLKSDTVVPE